MEQSVYEAKAIELFGEDRTKWAFRCPACGNVASVAKAREEWPELRGRGWVPEQECVGRYTDKVDCDWCAYGLLRGPVIIDTADGREVAIFDLEGTPFSDKGD